jgi:GNAT superfamily N-acetyltransferase
MRDELRSSRRADVNPSGSGLDNGEFTIIPFEQAHADGVSALFVTINRELTSAGMEDAFAAYVQRALNEEIDRIAEYFDPAAGNGFWVVVHDGAVTGMFGLERQSDEAVELRRMYLEQSFRGRGLAERMLERAEAEAVRLGYRRLVLSAAEIQVAALGFYRRSSFREVPMEIAAQTKHKAVEAGLTRFFFEKELASPPDPRHRVTPGLIQWCWLQRAAPRAAATSWRRY